MKIVFGCTMALSCLFLVIVVGYLIAQLPHTPRPQRPLVPYGTAVSLFMR